MPHDMTQFTVVAGVAATTLFIASYLPMLAKAWSTHDVSSYSRSSLVLANVGNLAQAVYVASLPFGPIWVLHAFYLGASALMLALHVSTEPRLRPTRRTR